MGADIKTNNNSPGAADIRRVLEEVSGTLRYYTFAGQRYGECSRESQARLEQWGRSDCLYAKDTINRINEEVAHCSRCAPVNSPVRHVCGTGAASARLMFVGGYPGQAAGEKQGLFAGESGRLLSKIIAAMKFTPDSVYVTCAVKCRPAAGGPPGETQWQECRRFLEREIAVVSPEVICLLGSFSVRAFMGKAVSLSAIRGQFCQKDGRMVMSTWHPADIIAQPENKRPLWEDLKKVMQVLRQPPE